MAYGTTIGDAALAAGYPLVAPTDDAREGYDHHNKTRDMLAGAVGDLEDYARDSNRLLPRHAGSRPHTFDAALSLYNGESPSLITATARIGRALRGENRCRFAAAGDSRTKTAGIAPDSNGQRAFQTLSLPAQIRELLGAREGEIYFDSQDDRITAISGFAFTASNFANNHIGTTGTAGSSVTIVLPYFCTGFDLWLFRTGTTAVASISVDGGAAETFAPGSGGSWKRFEKRGLANTVHTVKITIPPLTEGSFALSRIAPYYGATGLTVTNAGRSSSNATHWDGTVWSELLPTLLDPNGYTPDVVLLQLGTNWGASTYATFQSIVSKLRAAGAVVILACFGPRAEDSADPVWDDRRELIYDLADEFNLPLVDYKHIIGEYADAGALMADGVHESPGGARLESAATVRSIGNN